MTRPRHGLLQFGELAKSNHSVKFFDDSWDTTIEFAERYIAFKPPKMDCDGSWIYCLYYPLLPAKTKTVKTRWSFPKTAPAGKTGIHGLKAPLDSIPKGLMPFTKQTDRHLLTVMVERNCNTLRDI